MWDPLWGGTFADDAVAARLRYPLTWACSGPGSPVNVTQDGGGAPDSCTKYGGAARAWSSALLRLRRALMTCWPRRREWQRTRRRLVRPQVQGNNEAIPAAVRSAARAADVRCALKTPQGAGLGRRMLGTEEAAHAIGNAYANRFHMHASRISTFAFPGQAPIDVYSLIPLHLFSLFHS